MAQPGSLERHLLVEQLEAELRRRLEEFEAHEPPFTYEDRFGRDKEALIDIMLETSKEIEYDKHQPQTEFLNYLAGTIAVDLPFYHVRDSRPLVALFRSAVHDIREGMAAPTETQESLREMGEWKKRSQR